MRIRIQRVYEPPTPSDGRRILVDRLWPRGLAKVDAKIDYWAKATAPSNELRKWYGHDPDKWPEFKARYYAELEAMPAALEELFGELEGETVTFLYSSKERQLNNAVALKEFVESARSAGRLQVSRG